MTYELPEDVLFIIHQYSRPLFTYVTKYKRCIRTLDCRHLDELYDDIKHRLYMADAEDVIEAFVEFTHAYKATERSKCTLAKHEGHPDWQAFQRSVAINCEREANMFLELKILVYGEKIVKMEQWEW
jgi:hypothetical protein